MTTDLPVREHLAIYGCNEPLPARTLLRAGALSLERIGGRFGPVHAHGHEVWHGFAFLFRDAGWGTPEPVFEQVEHHSDAQGFRLALHGHIPCAPSDVLGEPVDNARLLLHLTLQGSADGTLHLHAQASPTHALRTNRCGWVLMHPMTAAGCALEVLHVDGRTSRSTLPEEVPAWPPFMGVRGLRHEYAPGHWAEAWLPGEDYELEDQRNNADASFKTYSRSNLMPRPYVLRSGQTLVREVHLRLSGPPPMPARTPPAKASRLVQTPAPKQIQPRLGVAITPTTSHCIEPWELDVLRQWRPAFLHLTLWTDALASDVDWHGVRTLLQASGADLRLDLCAREGLGHGGPQEAVLRHLAQQLADAGVAPASVAALPCGPQAAAWLRRLFPHATIGGGTPHFFAQLNRLESSGGEDFMTFTVCPIVHGTDDESVMHGLHSLSSMLETARRRHPGRAWHLGPSWLPARTSPLGSQPASDGQRRAALARLDPRTRGLFGAAWLLGHLAAAVRAGVQALTLPPLLGDDGLWWSRAGAWQATPAAALLDVCLRWHRLEHAELHHPDGTPASHALATIAGNGPQGRQVLVANLGANPQTLHWPHGGQWACLDAAAWVQHEDDPSRSPWRAEGHAPSERVLGPYALARIDLPLHTGD
jgi:hypothetical protein